MQQYKISLFIFRRDLRLNDNTALNLALKLSEQVIPCFIFDPVQIEKHPYQSAPGLQFMLAALKDLQNQFISIGQELNLLFGTPEKILTQLNDLYQINAVFLNRDYSPFSRKRDHNILETCRKLGVQLHYQSDALLTEPEQLLKTDSTPYKVFTPFYNKARLEPVPQPIPLTGQHFYSRLPQDKQYDFVPLIDNDLSTNINAGGRSKALTILDDLPALSAYKETRDFPANAGTSLLSAHLKFGTCSVREVFYAIMTELGPEHLLAKQLYWRDFFTHVGFHFPDVFGHAFHKKYDAIPWSNNQQSFHAWAEGKTGFPIVDAGMRELNKTGYMHNRVRMITASFLVKDLQVSWRWGERYFAQHLIDYDPCVNNGNWQWAASTGCDAQPYFRIFNPWLQQKKFDKDCQYIYKWVPELLDLPTEIIHQWDKKFFDCKYPKPIVNHKFQSEKSKTLFKAC